MSKDPFGALQITIGHGKIPYLLPKGPVEKSNARKARETMTWNRSSSTENPKRLTTASLNATKTPAESLCLSPWRTSAKTTYTLRRYVLLAPNPTNNDDNQETRSSWRTLQLKNNEKHKMKLSKLWTNKWHVRREEYHKKRTKSSIHHML